MPTGVIKSYSAEDGYGFIANGKKVHPDIFFHINETEEWSDEDNPEEGNFVSFRVAISDEGLCAKNVRSLKPSRAAHK